MKRKYIFNPYKRNPAPVEIESLESDGLTLSYFEERELEIMEDNIEAIAQRAQELFKESGTSPIIGLNAAWRQAIREFYLEAEIEFAR